MRLLSLQNILRLLNAMIFSIIIYNIYFTLSPPKYAPPTFTKTHTTLKQARPQTPTPTWKFSIQKTVAFIDQVSLLIPQATFALNNKNLEIRSTHQFEFSWLSSLEQINKIATQNNLTLNVQSCSFSQRQKQLISICIFKPLVKIEE